MKYMLLNIAYALDVVKGCEESPAEVMLNELMGFDYYI